MRLNLSVAGLVRERAGRGGQRFRYVPWSELCGLLLDAGCDWDWEVEVGGGGAFVLGRLTLRQAGVTAVRCALATVGDGGDNRYEVAEASAFRRCLAKFGVGLELWSD